MSTTEPIDYRAVLSDLEAKRAILERMIEGVKQFLVTPMPFIVSGAATENGGGKEPTAKAPESVELGDKPFIGVSVPEAVRKYLKAVKSKQSTTQIVEALERGGMQSVAKNFWRTVYSTLQRVWETQGDIVQIDGTNWALAEWFPGRKFERPKKQKGKAGRKPKDGKKVVVKTTRQASTVQPKTATSDEGHKPNEVTEA